jgi:poly-gamma-glutamate synthesis protein (capsule biosynthesis protein)
MFAKEGLSITIGGDVMLDRGVRKEINKIGYKKYLRKYAKYFRHSDFGIINLESAITNSNDKTPKKYNFRSDTSSLSELKAIGITHLNLANNHSIDFGACGLNETVENTKLKGLVPFGFFYNKNEECSPLIIEKNNVKVAVFSDVMLKMPNYHWDSCSNISVNHQYNIEFCSRISKFRNSNPDVTILVLLHWGWEDTVFARKSQLKVANDIVLSGADLIVGTHPHVIQNIEQIADKYVYYSIGNMIFDGRKKPGLILKVQFLKGRKKIINRFNLN